MQNSSKDLITAENLITSCNRGILETRNYVTFDNLERDAIELSKKCEGPEMFVEKRPHKKTFFDEFARDSVIEEARFTIETFYNLLDTFSNQLKERFKDFITVVQKFKVVDQTFFIQKSFNECEEALSELADMYESDTEKEDLLASSNLFVSCTSRMMLQDAVISEVHKICDVLHLPNRNERDLFSNLANFIEYNNVLPVSSRPTSAERSLAD